MPCRSLIEWRCDGCPSVLVLAQAGGIPLRWVIVEIAAHGNRRVSLMLCETCARDGSGPRALSAAVDEILSTPPLVGAA